MSRSTLDKWLLSFTRFGLSRCRLEPGPGCHSTHREKPNERVERIWSFGEAMADKPRAERSSSVLLQSC